MHKNLTKKEDATSHFQFLPEYALPYLIHLLAHHPNFTEDTNYKQCKTYLLFFLNQILKAENFLFLVRLLSGIKHTKDVQDPQSKNIHIVSEIALMLVKDEFNKRKWVEKKQPNGALFLPRTLYELLSEEEEESNALMSAQSQLPTNFQLSEIKKNSILQNTSTPTKDIKKNSKKRKQTQQEEESEDSDDEFGSSLSKKTITSGTRSRPNTQKNLKEDLVEDLEAESHDEEQSPSKATKERKKKERENGENEDEQESSEPEVTHLKRKQRKHKQVRKKT